MGLKVPAKETQAQICANLYFGLEGITIGAWLEVSSGSTSSMETVLTGASAAWFFDPPVSSERT